MIQKILLKISAFIERLDDAMEKKQISIDKNEIDLNVDFKMTGCKKDMEQNELNWPDKWSWLLFK